MGRGQQSYVAWTTNLEAPVVDPANPQLWMIRRTQGVRPCSLQMRYGACSQRVSSGVETYWEFQTVHSRPSLLLLAADAPEGDGAGRLIIVFQG